jgi:hypothetical protein
MSNYQINRQRWAQLTIQEQMGNIGSEVGRSIKAWGVHDTQRFDGALNRALDLFDATTEQLIAARSPRSKEVLRAKDQYLALFFDNTYETDAKNIENYFMQYALAARRDR